MVDCTLFVHFQKISTGLKKFQAVHGNDLRFQCPIDSY